MSTIWWLLAVIFALFCGQLYACAWGAIQNKKGYKEGYSNGYQNGANEKYHEVYNKRLIRQSQRTAAKEKRNEPANTERSDAGVQGNTEPSDSEPGSQSSGLFEHDADAGAGEVSPTEG